MVNTIGILIFLLFRTDGQNQERIDDISDLKTKMMQENAYLRSLSGKTLGVYFNAYRSKAYDGGGEENLTFNGTYCNNGGGLDVDTGIFTCPTGGTYLFMFHIATHDNKKALLSIRKNGEEIASVFDQNHKDNHKNSMAGQTVILDLVKGDEVGLVIIVSKHFISKCSDCDLCLHWDFAG